MIDEYDPRTRGGFSSDDAVNTTIEGGAAVRPLSSELREKVKALRDKSPWWQAYLKKYAVNPPDGESEAGKNDK